MTVSPSAETVVYIHRPVAGTNAAFLDQLSEWVEIGEVDSLGDIGEVFGTVTRTSFTTGPRVEHMKTVSSGKTVDVSIGRDYDDAGQTILEDALKSWESYLFKVELNDARFEDYLGSRLIFRALVIDLPTSVGSADGIIHRNATLQINSEIYQLNSESEIDSLVALDLNFITGLGKSTRADSPDGYIPVSQLVNTSRNSRASYFDSSGILRWAEPNELRMDNEPVTGEPEGALIESAATNLLLWSENFSNAYWGTGNVTIVPNVTDAPDGTLSADKIVANSTSGSHRIFRAQSLTSGTNYTPSIFVKAAEYGFARIEFYYGPSAVALHLNLNDGTFPYVSGGLPSGSYGAEPCQNGWWRFWATAQTAQVGGQVLYISGLPTGANGGQNFTGDGTSGVYLWGAQLEAGSRPSSYIKTEGAQATRAADVVSTPFPWNDGDGTLRVDDIVTPPAIVGESLNISALVTNDHVRNIKWQLNANA